MTSRDRILFLLKMPPPLTGATYMNSIVYQSEAISSGFTIQKIAISYADSVKDLGKVQLKKFMVFTGTFFKLLFAILFKRPRFIYFQPSILGATFVRDLILILTGRIFGVKFILHLHGKGIKTAAKKTKLSERLYRLGMSDQYLIVLSEHQKEDIRFLDPRKIYVVNNGIDELKEARRVGRSMAVKPFKFLFLSNLLRSKGLFALLDTASTLKKMGYAFTIDLVGNEGDINKEGLFDKIKILDLENTVFYHGAKYNEQKIPFFEAADAFVFPTQNDAFGLVLIEAMQFSLPVIATDEGAIPEIVENERSGFIYSRNDVAALGILMAKMIDAPDQALVMGKRGREIYKEKFTLENFENNVLSVFHQTIFDLKT